MLTNNISKYEPKLNMYLVVDDYGDLIDMRGRSSNWDFTIDRAFHFIGESSFRLHKKWGLNNANPN